MSAGNRIDRTAIKEAIAAHPGSFTHVNQSNLTAVSSTLRVSHDFEARTSWCVRDITIPNRVFTVSLVLQEKNTGYKGKHRQDAVLVEEGGYLIPVGTESVRQTQLAPTPDAETLPLSQCLTEMLPDTVVLTRALCSEEAGKYRRGDRSLGSSRDHLWDSVVHTAVHNVTNEFPARRKYQQVIKFALPKDSLQAAVAEGSVTLAAYNYQFATRLPDSPFVFEAEARFKEPAYDLLFRGYQAWTDQAGVFSEPYSYANSGPFRD